MHEIRVKVVKVAGRKYLQMRYIDPSGEVHQKSTKETNRRAAERKAALWEQELIANRHASDGRMSWIEFRKRYEEACSGLASETVRRIRTVFNSFEDAVKPERIADVTAAVIGSWFASMRKAGRSETTLHTYGGALKAALQWAVDCELLSEVPKFPKVQRAKVGNKSKVMKGRPITDEEFSRILSVASEDWHLLLKGLWLSGLRLEESLILTWEPGSGFWVDFSGEFPMFRIDADSEKGNRDRILPMTPDFAEFLGAITTDQRQGFVFPVPKERYQDVRLPGTIGRRISAFGKAAGVVVDEKSGKFASAHDLRRSFGERWARKVMPQVLMELMRHESIETTMKYYVGRNAEATAREIWGKRDDKR